MTKNTKGRNGGDRATQKTLYSRNHTSIASRVKALIVGAVCWGFIPANFAVWIIKCLRLENV